MQIENRVFIVIGATRELLGFSLAARAELARDHSAVSEIHPAVTATNSGRHRMRGPDSGGPSTDYAAGDRPESVAGLVLRAIEAGEARYFANAGLAAATAGRVP